MNLEKLNTQIAVLEESIKYTFRDKTRLVHALTHSSFANEKNKHLNSNERYEFLGDSVLNIAVSEYIFLNKPNLLEGEMTKARASIVCEAPLAKCANHINLGSYLLLGKGEELSGGRTRPSILADAFEALICAIYLDGGIDNAKVFIYHHLKDTIESVVNGALFIDYKTKLQEIVQKKGDIKVVYEVLSEEGPDHDKHFIVQVRLGERILGKGNGKTKKAAEQNSARIALETLKVDKNA